MTKRQANVILLAITIVWGLAFVAQRSGSEHMSALSFNAARFLLGGSLVAMYSLWKTPCVRSCSNFCLTRDGLILGCTLTLAALLQQHGVSQTSTANVSFLTIMNVIFVPMLARFIGYAPRLLEIVGAGMAVVGAYFMSVEGDFSVRSGDWWVLGSALFWALHILLISLRAHLHNPLKLASEQFLVCGIMSTIGAFALEDIHSQNITAALPAILFAGAISVAVAYTLQVVAQRYVTPSHAVIILSLEGVFGALAGWLLCGESMSVRAMAGASILTLGVVVAQMHTATSSAKNT